MFVLGLFRDLSIAPLEAAAPAAATLTSAVLVVIVILIISHRVKTSASPIPLAPGAIPLLGHTVTVLKNYHRFNDLLVDMSRAVGLGKPYRLSLPLGQSYIVLTSPAAIEHTLKTNFSNYIKGPENHKRFRDLLGEGIFNVDGHPWKVQRKLAATIFSVRAFRDFVSSTFQDKMGKLYSRLDRAAGSGEILDVQDLLFRFTLDSFCSIGFGMDPACLNSEAPGDFALAFDRSQMQCHRRFLYPAWRLVESLSGQGSTMRRDVATIRQFARKVIAARRGAACPVGHESDLLSLFMGMTDEATGQPIGDELLVDYVLNFIIAGRDTTANALAWSLYELSRHPQHQERMLREVSEQLAKGHAALPSYDDIRRMRYSHAVLLETLRLHPSVGKQVKYAVDADTLPDGTPIPAGAPILFTAYVMGRSEAIWGADAADFEPERWLRNREDGSPASLPSSYEYPVFNAGPRLCLGKGLAELEGVFVLVSLLLRYRLEVVAGQNVTYMTTLTMPMAEGLKVKVARR